MGTPLSALSLLDTADAAAAAMPEPGAAAGCSASAQHMRNWGKLNEAITPVDTAAESTIQLDDYQSSWRPCTTASKRLLSQKACMSTRPELGGMQDQASACADRTTETQL